MTQGPTTFSQTSNTVIRRNPFVTWIYSRFPSMRSPTSSVLVPVAVPLKEMVIHRAVAHAAAPPSGPHALLHHILPAPGVLIRPRTRRSASAVAGRAGTMVKG